MTFTQKVDECHERKPKSWHQVKGKSRKDKVLQAINNTYNKDNNGGYKQHCRQRVILIIMNSEMRQIRDSLGPTGGRGHSQLGGRGRESQMPKLFPSQ